MSTSTIPAPESFELFGFDIEPLPEGSTSAYGEPIAYRAWGKRGAIYDFVRYTKSPEFFFLRNRKTGVCDGVNLKGNYTFTDRDGRLRPTTDLERA